MKTLSAKHLRKTQVTCDQYEQIPNQDVSELSSVQPVIVPYHFDPQCAEHSRAEATSHVIDKIQNLCPQKSTEVCP